MHFVLFWLYENLVLVSFLLVRILISLRTERTIPHSKTHAFFVVESGATICFTFLFDQICPCLFVSQMNGNAHRQWIHFFRENKDGEKSSFERTQWGSVEGFVYLGWWAHISCPRSYLLGKSISWSVARCEWSGVAVSAVSTHCANSTAPVAESTGPICGALVRCPPPNASLCLPPTPPSPPPQSCRET